MLYNMKKAIFCDSSPNHHADAVQHDQPEWRAAMLPPATVGKQGSGGSTARYCGPLANLLALSSPRLIQPRPAQKPTALPTQDAPLTHWRIV